METPYSTTSAQSAASFFYYTPDPQARPRHHGHFLPHPQALAASPQLLAPTPISPMTFPSQLAYGGSDSNRSLAPVLSITPAASPSLLKRNDMTESYESPDVFFHPATPPLSHSAMSTPAMTHALLTPMSNHGWSQDEQPSCSTIAPFEMQLPGTPVDWNAGSPEFTPIYVFPTLPSNCSPPPSIVINDNFCPALSPSSSHTSSSPDLDFCDPRHLTFPTTAPAESEFGLEFPALPTIGEEHNLLLGGDLVSIKTEEKSFNAFGFDFIDDLSDFESEDDFISGFAKLSDATYNSPSKRQRFEDSDFSANSSEDEERPSSRTTRQTSCSTDDHNNHSHSHSDDGSDSEEELTEEERIRSFKFGNNEHSRRSSKPNGLPINPNVIRRGRKQSLTEDPSKTFVCHLCNRRFRRQEHLKRHFRSLHTEDKPFSCGECGKKFSRSDNLTQHARIHGSGAILLGVLEENEVMDGHQQFSLQHEDTQSLGIVVVDALQAAAGASMKDNKSSEEKRNRRKRRRSEE